MPRRKAVEGLTLDLTDMPMGEFDMEAFILEAMQNAAKEEPVLTEKKPRAAPRIVKEPVVRDISAGLIVLNEILDDELKCLYCDNKVYLQKQCLDCRINTRRNNMKEMRAYLIHKGINGCAFCNRPHTESMRGFHFDHLNIYNKADNVGFMIQRHIDMTKVFEEIDKCQLLCVPCHAIITKIETRNGFIRDKKKKNKGKLETSLEELAAEYDRIMIPVYDELRRRFGGAK